MSPEAARHAQEQDNLIRHGEQVGLPGTVVREVLDEMRARYQTAVDDRVNYEWAQGEMTRRAMDADTPEAQAAAEDVAEAIRTSPLGGTRVADIDPACVKEVLSQGTLSVRDIEGDRG